MEGLCRSGVALGIERNSQLLIIHVLADNAESGRQGRDRLWIQ